MSDRLALTVTLEFSVSEEVKAEALPGLGEAVMEELLKLEAVNADVTDAAVSTDTIRGMLTVDLLVYTTEPVRGLQRALDITRTALHAAGQDTPGWPSVHPELTETHTAASMVAA